MYSKIQLSLDKVSFTSKPNGREIGKINNRIADGRIAVSIHELHDVIKKIGEQGSSFSPATFRDGKRSKESFEQQQLFVLDIDNEHPQEKLFTPKEALLRADENHLPILMIYETFSSTGDHPRFRILFLNDGPVTDKRLAEDMNQMLGRIFPEADRSCVSDYSKIYFGGKKILYESNSYCADAINVELLWRQFYLYLRKKDPKHCRAILERFLKGDELQITTTTDSEFNPNAFDLKNGDNLHSSIIYSNIGEGRKSPFYNVAYTQGISKNSLPPDKNKDSKEGNYHKKYKSSVLDKLTSHCRLFKDFVSGSREMTHDELFGIGTALVNVEGGRSFFLKICETYPSLHSNPNFLDEWGGQLTFFSKNKYLPKRCDHPGYCKYCDKCKHGKNMLSLAGQKKGTIEKIYDDTFELCEIEEAEESLQQAIHEACCSPPQNVTIIGAQCALGKSERTLSEALTSKLLISVPTNTLKEELYTRGTAKGAEIVMTPSLDSIYDVLPDDVSRHIKKLRKNGMNIKVHPFIEAILQKKNIPPLSQYMKDRELALNSQGSLITTHRNFSVKKYEDKYDAYIVDEDILFDTYISSHQEVSKKKLKKAQSAPLDAVQKDKLKELLCLIKNSQERFVTLDSLDWEIEDDDDTSFYGCDLKALLKAKNFYIRPENKKLGTKAAVLFVDPPSFPQKNFIVMSATANETIYRAIFGDDVEFKHLPQAKYKGQVIQYYGLSMSRSCIQNHPGIIQYIQKNIKKGAIIDDEATLTYKGYVNNEIYFGNLVGKDNLKGIDSLVIGSAYQPSYVYGLAAMALGLPFDESLTMNDQPVEYNGCRFWYKTFDDTVLRDIQMWMTESELEQAVGRSRPLRTSATVYVCSNFPVRQADYRDGREELYKAFLHAQ